MVALLEATMWRQIRDPEFLLGALKTYRMMTGLSPMDPAFAKDWWTSRPAGVRRDPALPDRGRARPPARRHRPHALRRELHRRPTTRWSRRRCRASARSRSPSAPTTRCSPTRRRPRCPTGSRRASPGRTAPRSSSGARGRRCGSASTGIYTYAGFHERGARRGCEDVAAQAGARPLGLRRRLPGERRRLGRRRSPTTC